VNSPMKGYREKNRKILEDIMAEKISKFDE
jgi:hypothetical protein